MFVLIFIIYDIYPLFVDGFRHILGKSYIKNIGELGNDYEKLDAIVASTGDFEGHIGHWPKKIKLIQEIIKEYNIQNVCEIGFNAGHSAALFLNNGIKNVTSFDLCEHKYTKECLSYLQKKYPDQLKVICGDSTKTVPKYTGERFDLIFIDGGHFGNIPDQDIANTLKFLAKKDSNKSIILMDDISYSYIVKSFGKFFGFTVDEAWTKYLKSGKIKLIKSVRGLSAGTIL